MLVEMAVNKRGGAEVAVLRPGADINVCALDIIDSIMISCKRKMRFEYRLIKEAASIIDDYFYIDSIGEIYHRMAEKFGAEISRHPMYYEHVYYELPDDFFNALDVFNDMYSNEFLALRSKIYKSIEEAPTWKQFKDRLLAIRAAEAL
jgi:hypothetical protein